MEQNTPVAMPVMDGGKQSNGKGLKIATAIASIVAVCGIGFGVYGVIQSNVGNDEIEKLKAQVSEYEEAEKSEKQTVVDVDDLSEISTTDNDESQIEVESSGDYTLLANKFKNASDQRYELVFISGGLRTAFNNISSEDDKYYILDTNKLGSADDLKEFDLVSVMKPLTNQKIQNMPEYASYNVYSNDDKMYLSQCESFSVEYFNGHDYLIQSIGFDLSKEIPIAVNYTCHYNNGSTQRLYHRAIYSLNAETGTVRELEQYSTSDFTNN